MFGDLFSQRGDYSKGVFYAGQRKFLVDEKHDLAMMPKKEPKHSDSIQPPLLFKTKQQARKDVLTSSKKSLDASNEVTFQISGFHINFPKKNDGENDFTSNLKGKQDVHKKPKKGNNGMIVFDNYSSIHRSDWTEEVQAGCRIWINHSTGEVSTVCPWLAVNNNDSIATSNNASDSASGGNLKRENTPSNIRSMISVSNDSMEISDNGRNQYSNNEVFGNDEDKESDRKNVKFSDEKRKEKNEIVTEEGTGSLAYDSTEINNLFQLLDNTASASKKTKNKK
jgi:hypothetical protein